jgi:N-acetyl-gamma-glutamylphosphate reductase
MNKLTETTKAVTDSAVPKDALTADALVQLIQGSSAETKSLMAKALGVSTVTKKRRKGNIDALQNMRTFGEAYHGENFVPVAPEAIALKGERAVALWQKKWLEGDQVSSTGVEYDEDFEALALTASE